MSQHYFDPNQATCHFDPNHVDPSWLQQQQMTSMNSADWDAKERERIASILERERMSTILDQLQEKEREAQMLRE